MSYRVGYGFDVHQLKEGLPFALGGIHIKYHKGSLGHSDADVLIHSICDALLGASNLGDIGTNFPDDNDAYKNIDSKILLKKVVKLIKEKGFIIINIDSTICLENPKISSYILKMRSVLADCMNIDSDLISIKATTTERLGFIGREEGVAAHATVLIKKDC